MQGDHSSRNALVVCSRYAHGARCPSLASSRRHRRCCVLAVHIGRLLYRSRHIVQGDHSSRDALVVCSRCSMLFFGVKPPPPPLSSRRPYRTFTIPLSPLSRAIVQVETRSLCAHGARCPSLASGRRRCCALAVHIGRLHRSGHRAGRSFKSRCALCAHGARCPSLASGSRRRSVLSPST